MGQYVRAAKDGNAKASFEIQSLIKEVLCRSNPLDRVDGAASLSNAFARVHGVTSRADSFNRVDGMAIRN